jgi:hypothetical protein
MRITTKFLAVLTVVCALVGAQVALASGLTATATPSHLKQGKYLEIRITGLKPGEKIKALALIVSTGQKDTYYPKQRASTAGVIIVQHIKAQVKGKHVWTITGRTSHRKGKATYVVK